MADRLRGARSGGSGYAGGLGREGRRQGQGARGVAARAQERRVAGAETTVTSKLTPRKMAAIKGVMNALTTALTRSVNAILR